MDEDEDDELQSEEWETLYERIVELLQKFGVEDPFGKEDYLVVDDNYGYRGQKIEIHKLRMLNLEVVRSLHGLLKDFPNWTIVISVDIPGKEAWPPMGVTIRAHEIIDGLQRQYLPAAFKDFKIPGSRPGTGYD